MLLACQFFFWFVWIATSWGAFILMMLSKSPSSLRYATGFFASAVIVYCALFWVWQKLNEPGDVPEGVNTIASTGRFLITLEGVLIGLVFTAVKTTPPDIVLKVGLTSLAASLTFGVILVIVSSDGIRGDRAELASTLLSNTGLLALTYGLTCITAEVLSRK